MTDGFEPLRVGVLGLGRAFTLMLPTLAADPRIQLVACCDPYENATALFRAQFGAQVHESAQALCADPNVEWVYIATPHPLHEAHAALAAAHGKHVLVEKPMALSLLECDRMIHAAQQAGTHLVVGHSHSFDSPVGLARALIQSGRYGPVRSLLAFNFTDFLYRPRRPEELETAKGGGVVFSQAAHQIDVVRLLAGGLVTSVYARTGAWDSARPTEGAYSAILNFESGAFAQVHYNGYGFFDSDVWMDQVGELGHVKKSLTHQATRQKRIGATDEMREVAQKAERNYGGPAYTQTPLQDAAGFQHFGPVLVSCSQADLRLTPQGVEVHDVQGVQLMPCAAMEVPRQEVVDELWSVARQGAAPLHNGAWSKATMEVCLGILASAQQGQLITMQHQIAPVLPG
jgi:phthalate 4,5-cis-dihydrodiol dehydrogenase